MEVVVVNSNGQSLQDPNQFILYLEEILHLKVTKSDDDFNKPEAMVSLLKDALFAKDWLQHSYISGSDKYGILHNHYKFVNNEKEFVADLESNKKLIIEYLSNFKAFYDPYHKLNYLRKHFWKEYTFWIDGYFACSVGNVSEEMLRKYIENQG